MDAQTIAIEMQQRKQRNLDFFKQYFPSIYESFKDKSFERSQINLDPKTLEINLLQNDRAIYPLEVQKFNEDEAKDFSDTFGPNATDLPLRRSFSTDFYAGRYGHGSIRQYLNSVEDVAGSIKPYCFTESLPQVVFLGCGIGSHITALNSIRPIRHITVVEHDPDKFVASLYVTDWDKLITPYLIDKTKSFYLAISDRYIEAHASRLQLTFGSAWNHICLNVPFMPIQTVYYVHQADPFYHEVAARLNKELQSYTNVWGFYDDEVNQLNQTLHNIEQGLPTFRAIDLSAVPKISIVCGNGPSIDTYMPLFKKYRDRLIIIAAGSAAYTLLMNDIMPDFMVTIESHYGTYVALKDLPRSKSKELPIIGAAQIAPKTFDLFADGLIFLKGESTYSKVLDKHNLSVHNSPTSATNGALAIALDLKLSNLYLVGMEFGFLNKHQTHSATSFYYDDENKEKWEDAKKKMAEDAFKVETNQHGDIYTTPFYNTARVHIEKNLKRHGRRDIINLSKGASIESTLFMDEVKFETILQEAPALKLDTSIFSLIKSKSVKYSKKDTQKVKQSIHKSLSKICTKLVSITKELDSDLESIEATLFKLNQTVIYNKDPELALVNSFIRGSVWQWLYNFYALCKEIEAKDKRNLYTTHFKNQFAGFLYYLPDHYIKFVSYRSEDDPKLLLTLEEDEPNIEKWLDKIKNFQLDRIL